MNITKMTDLNLYNKRLFIRSDLNVPIKNGIIKSYNRIHASLLSIKFALKKGANVILASHLGRPIEGEFNNKFSLKPIANYLNKTLNINVRLVKEYIDGIDFKNKELIILENVRFNKGEKNNDKILSKKYSSLCDIFVMDAFGSAHRKHSSTYGIGEFVSYACAGKLLINELKFLQKLLYDPMRPMIAIIGGSKVSNKINVLSSIIKIADTVIIGGGIANTFIAAKGYNIGKSLYEPKMIPFAKKLLKYNNILMPVDVKVTSILSKTAESTTRLINQVESNEYILDLGDISIDRSKNILKKAKTILWNGPLGVFEFYNFRKSTKIISHIIADSNALSIVGGGETVEILDFYKITKNISYISTGGGSFLDVIAGKQLASVKMLKLHKIK